MEIPKSVKVGAHVYEIDQIRDPVVTGDWVGCQNSGFLAIKLDATRKPSVKAHTLLHEIMHAVWDDQGLEGHEQLKDHEEFIVNALSSGLYRVLSENSLHFDK